MLDDELQRYRDMFGEAFPLMLCLDMTEEEILERIRACIDRGEVYESEHGLVF